MNKTILTLIFLALLTACSSSEKDSQDNNTEVIERLNKNIDEHHLDSALAIIDSLENAKVELDKDYDYWRATAYDFNWQYKVAAYYYQRSLETRKKPIENWEHYLTTIYQLSVMHINLDDIDKALNIAVKGVEICDSLRKSNPKEQYHNIYGWLIMQISYCQYRLQQYDEAKHNCLKSFEEISAEEDENTVNKMLLCMGISWQLYDTDNYQETFYWLDKAEQIHKELSKKNEPCLKDLLLEYNKQIANFRAILLIKQGKTDEAADAYESRTDTNMFKHPLNIETSVIYLMKAKRYQEALVMMDSLEKIKQKAGCKRVTFDCILEKMKPRYEANRKSGNTAEALNVADNICNALDSALTLQKRSDAAEFSVIYETQQKERALEQKEAEANIQFVIILSLILVLSIFSIALWRILAAQKKLLEKNRQLFETVQQIMAKEEQAEEWLEEQSENDLTATQKLYRQLIELMRTERPYTNSDLNRNDLARMLGTNYNYVAEAIRVCAEGKTVNEFIDDCRIRHAAQMIADTDEPMSIVSEMSGFQSRSHFNTLFRTKYKMTPTEYRAMAKTKQK
ncbi:MAG: helix-turn-helix transcriptional regulator [Bacteroidaceae bacterium]|nr:helix-turn-helix transcriptional regulator [Bacteroidaceae bacterium]